MSLGRFVGSPRSLAVAVTTIACLTFGLTTPVSATPPDSGCPTASAPVQSGSEYLISTAANFQWLKEANVGGADAQLGYDYRQTADIDFSGCTWYTVIGPSGAGFRGIYDGGGHTIENLSLSATSPDGLGVFGRVTGDIRDVHLRDVTLTTSSANVGLLVGANFGTVANSSGTGAVTAGDNVGGLIGNVLGASGVVEESWANVNVVATDAGSYAGGLVGVISEGSLLRSFASGSVRAVAYTGGLVGLVYNGGVIEDSYATASVSGASNGAGLVGSSASSPQIRRSYAVGSVAATFSRFGFTVSGNPTVSANFWDTQTTGQSVAGISATATGKTTAQMKDFTTFSDAGWSITNGYSTSTTWGICARFNNGYPFLTALQTTDVCSDAGGSDPGTAVLTLNAGEAASCRASTLDGTRGTWIALPDATTCSASPETPDATLLGWATTRDFPTEIAQRQVDNGWGPYETFDADGRMTGVFIPAGGSTFLSRSNNLYAVWSS